MNLYNKYRPKTFDEVIGNEDVVTYLQEALQDAENAPHVYLLSGQTGCGKTTLSRIIADKLGCTELDYKEINAADFRGIDTVRELIRQSQYKALGGGIRVWVIDECHKLTNDAQNALLKVLEEPPKNVFFVLGTTEPNKLLGTIKGRCIQLQVNPLTDMQMKKLLKRIAKAEGHKLKKVVYRQMVQDSLGLPRNGIQILDKVLKTPAERQLAVAKQTAVELSESIELCRTLISAAPWKKVSAILKGIKESGQEPESVRRHVLGYAQSVLLRGENDRAALVIEEFYEPLYDIGFPGLVYASYSVTKS